MRFEQTDTEGTTTFEYHGSTVVEQVWLLPGGLRDRRWWMFDTVADAESFFYACDAGNDPCNA